MRFIIEIDIRQKAAKSFLDLLKALPFIKSVEREEQPNKTTIKAIEDARKGKTYKVKNENNNIVDDILND